MARLFEQHPDARFKTGDIIEIDGLRSIVACGHLELSADPEGGAPQVVDRVSAVFIDGPHIFGPIPVGGACDYPASLCTLVSAHACATAEKDVPKMTLADRTTAANILAALAASKGFATHNDRALLDHAESFLEDLEPAELTRLSSALAPTDAVEDAKFVPGDFVEFTAFLGAKFRGVVFATSADGDVVRVGFRDGTTQKYTISKMDEPEKLIRVDSLDEEPVAHTDGEVRA